jgi:hypothetical protein
MPTSNHRVSPSSRRNNLRSRPVSAPHLTFWFVLLLLGVGAVVVLSSSFAASNPGTRVDGPQASQGSQATSGRWGSRISGNAPGRVTAEHANFAALLFANHSTPRLARTLTVVSPLSGTPFDKFYGLRYLQYGAFLATTVAPTLSDVTNSFTDLNCSDTPPTITATPPQVCANSTGNTASGPDGMTAYSWQIANGTITSSSIMQSVTYTAGASGDVTLTLTATSPLGCVTPNSLMVQINPIPATPTITPGGATTFCPGNSVTLTSDSATGNQWYLDGNPIGGATNQQYIASVAGGYTVVVSQLSCGSAPSATTNVVVNSLPATPTITPGGPTTFCAGGSVTLTSSSASGNQWYLNANPIGGATNQAYVATAAGNYTVTVTDGNSCSSTSSGASVTVNPIPATPTITPGGPTTFATGGNVTLTSSSADGNQWYLNGNPIGGATSQDYLATAAGDYTVTITTSGCTSAPSAATTVTVTPLLPPTISKLFLPDTVASSETTLLSFTVSNPNNNPEASVTLTGIAFTDNLPAGLLIATPNELSDDCGGTVTATPGSASLSLSGGTVAPPVLESLLKIRGLNAPAEGACFITVRVQAPAELGTLENTTGQISSDQTGPGATSNTATLTVTVPKAPPTIAKEFGASSIPLGGTTALTFTLANPNSSVDLVNISASDTLPAGLFVSNPDSLSATCEAEISANPGSNTIGITGLNLPASGSCSFTLNVTGTSAGTKNNISDNVTATYDDGTGNFVLITGGAATATIQVLQGSQTIAFETLTNKTFGDADFTVSAIASSDLPVSFTATGNCTVTTLSPGTVHLAGAGSCSITAAQSGNADYEAALSVTRDFVIAQATTTTTVSASINPSGLAESVTFTAAVHGPAGAGSPAGTAQFVIDGSNADAPVVLDANGLATFSSSTLAAGNHTVTVEYSGDTNFIASSGTLAGGQTVNNRPLLSLSQSNYNVNENTGFVTITVARSGDVSVPVLVDYATDDTGAATVCSTLNSGMASSRCDFGLVLGTLSFAANETAKTFIIPITQDSFTEGAELFTVNLSNLTGASLTGTSAAFASPASATVTINDSEAPAPNAIDDTATFVRQQYRDFLNREADAAGLAFWSNQIDSCGSDAVCRDARRVNVSAAFFLSIEFQTTGNLVRSFYVAALDRPLTNNMPEFVEFVRDSETMQRGVIVGQGNWQQILADNGDAFMADFVMRPEFVGLYPTTDTPAQYVDKLYLHSGITPTTSERADAISEFAGAPTAAEAGARGRALLHITRNGFFQSRERNRSFVQMEYFGYLRRNPNDAPDGNFVGYNFWLNKLNAAAGDFVTSDMVKSFLTSSEYRGRFGP